MPQTIPLDLVFRLGSSIALVGWLLLAALPHWRGVARLVSGLLIPALLAIAYAGLVMAWWSRTQGGFGSLGELATAFGTRGLLLAGWLHYLAFDMLIGAWEVRDARRQGMPHWSILPALGLTFMFGPAGYLVFLVQRAAWQAARRPRIERAPGLRRLLAGAEPRLFAAGLAMLATVAPTFAAHLVDDRLFGGEPLWLKPLRFELALSLYLLTLAVYYPMAGAAFRSTRLGRFVVWGAIVPAWLEAGYIALQAGRGMASHYNLTSPLYTALYGVMGVGAVTLILTAPALAWGVARTPRPARDTGAAVLRLAVIAGLVLTFVLGGLEGVYMSAAPGHLVGAVAGAAGRGLPVVGWSRRVGDLRVAHFIGIHAQQAIPLFGLMAAAVLAAPWARRAVWAFAALYSAVFAAALVQAVAGLPILS